MTHPKSTSDQVAAFAAETHISVEPSPPRKLRKPRGKAPPPVFVALADETRCAVDTACAAWHLGRKPQTLRFWASSSTGAVTPVNVHGRLAWPVSSLRRALGFV